MVDLGASRSAASELPSPVLTASGTFGHGDEVAKLGDPARLGAVTAKSISPEPWAGKPAPRLHMTASGMLNAVGLQGPGIDGVVGARSPRAARDRRARDRVGVGPHRRRLRARDRDARRRRRRRRRGQRELPQPPREHLRPTIRTRRARWCAAVVRRDLTARVRQAVAECDRSHRDRPRRGRRGRRRPHPGEHRDGSGDRRRDPATGARWWRWGTVGSRDQAGRGARRAHRHARAARVFPVIGTGGVQSGVDAVEMLLAGASAVAVGTANFRDPRAPYRVLDELCDWCARHDVARVRDLTGALEDR